MTKTQFCNEFSHAALASAVIRQCGGWDSFKEMASDVSNHGADGGFHGFIYYTETVKFAKANQQSIMEMARDMANDFGTPGAISLVAGFNCLRDMKLTGDDVASVLCGFDKENATQVYNALAWFALEEVSRRYVDECEIA